MSLVNRLISLSVQLSFYIAINIPDNNEKNIKLVIMKATFDEEEISASTIEQPILDDADDKKLRRKLDLHLIPTMTLLYLLSYLDRVNIGQAEIDGLTQSIHITSAQYNACLSVFFATYVIFEVPSNLLLKRLRPSRWIPSIMIIWGIVMTLMGLANSYGSLLACRLLLGAAESGLFPGNKIFIRNEKIEKVLYYMSLGATFYLSSWYKRRELSWRISILFSAVALAGAFGGILAFGINKMNGLGGQEGWRWIFYIEGIVTVIVGVIAFSLINDFPSDRPKFLTEKECDRTISRLQNDAGPGAGEQFSWKQVRAAFSDWKIYVFGLCYIGLTEPFYSLSLFSPTIVQSLGFTSYRAQLMTAPPYAFAFVTTMTTAYLSDRYARRAVFILFWLTISITGFIILITVQDSNVKYFAVFLTTGGISPCIATCITFLSCNISPHTKRATAVAFMLSVGNSGGAISGQVYRSQDSPRFILGHAINLGFCVMALIAASILLISLRLENRRRDRLYGRIVTNNSKRKSKTTNINKEIVDVCGLGSEEDRRKWGYENMSEEEIRDLGDKHATWRYIL
jgi:MFS family permease